MAVTDVPTVDVALALEAMLEPTGYRVHAYVPDTFRPPGVILAQPDIDFADQASGFCWATFSFPVSVIVSRNADRPAQEALARMTLEVARAFSVEPPGGGLVSVEPQVARPTTVNVAGTDLPGYQMRVLVRA